MAWLTMPALIGPVLGPPLGGFIVTYFSWRWIFLHQRADRRARHRAGHAVRRGHARAARGQLRLASASCCPASALAGLMFGLETVGRGVVPPLGDGRHDRRRAGAAGVALLRCTRAAIRRRCSILR